MIYLRKQILVVDDELSVHKILSRLLSMDYDLVIKHNGAEAISWLENGNNPDLIISDLEMPYVDGASFIHSLKVGTHHCNTPVILLSGAENLEDIVERMAHRANFFFKKPFSPSEFKSCISATLSYNVSNSGAEKAN